MSDEKTDLILNVVTEIRAHQKDFGKTDADVNLKLNKLSDEFTELKKRVAERFKVVQHYAVSDNSTDKMNLEMMDNLNGDSKIVNRLELEIIAIKIDAIDTREKVQELETRVSRLENHINSAA